MNYRVSLLAAVLPALASCERPAAEAAPARTAAPARHEPSEWQPDDPELARGRAIYQQTCHLCHEEGEQSAPRLRRREVWAERAAKGTDVLIRHAIEGYRGSEGEMPARGGEDTHTDEDIAAAVKFMVAASQRTPTD